MEEPLIPPSQKTESPGRTLFIWFKFLLALAQLVPGVGLCVYTSLSPGLESSYKTWFAFSAAVLTFAGSMQLIAICLYALQARKAAYLWAGLGSQWVNCMVPVPMVLLLVFGASLPAGEHRGLVLGVMVLVGCVMVLNVLCEWKKACFVCISFCGICETKQEQSRPQP